MMRNKAICSTWLESRSDHVSSQNSPLSKLYPVIEIRPEPQLVRRTNFTRPAIVPLAENIFIIRHILEINKKLLHKSFVIHAVTQFHIDPEICICAFVK